MPITNAAREKHDAAEWMDKTGPDWMVRDGLTYEARMEDGTTCTVYSIVYGPDEVSLSDDDGDDVTGDVESLRLIG